MSLPPSAAVPSPGPSSAPGSGWRYGAGWRRWSGGFQPPPQVRRSGWPQAPHWLGYRTGLEDLAIQGAITGLGVGILQALVLRQRVATWFWWALATPPLWALGWVVTTAAGVGVGQNFTNFGATGAIVVTILSGLLLVQLLRAPRPIEAEARPAVAAA